MRSLVLTCWILLFFFWLTNADILQVTFRRGKATLRAKPSSASSALLRLSYGDELILLSNQRRGRYYHARDAASKLEGWIYSLHVRRKPDSPVPPVEPTRIANCYGPELPSCNRPQDMLFRHAAYWNCYDTDMRQPRWVSYYIQDSYLSKVPKNGPKYIKDMAVPDPVIYQDFKDTPDYYQAGHLAPYNVCGGDRTGGNADYNIQTIRECNLVSNMSPQIEYFNTRNGFWRDLEDWIQKRFVQKEPKHSVYVMAGPIFGPESTREYLIPPADSRKHLRIPIPTAFWKLVIASDVGDNLHPFALAWILPHRDHDNNKESIWESEYLVSIDDIETKTGLDLFSWLSSEWEQRIESLNTDKLKSRFTRDCITSLCEVPRELEKLKRLGIHVDG